MEGCRYVWAVGGSSSSSGSSSVVIRTLDNLIRGLHVTSRVFNP